MRSSAALLEGDNAKEALDGFGQVLKMETEQGEWCALTSVLHAAHGAYMVSRDSTLGGSV